MYSNKTVKHSIKAVSSFLPTDCLLKNHAGNATDIQGNHRFISEALILQGITPALKRALEHRYTNSGYPELVYLCLKSRVA